MANFDVSLDELDIKARVKLMIWEITKDDGRKFASPQEIAKRLNLKPGYIRSVISEMEESSTPQLAERRYHAPGKTRGRKRIDYRIHDESIIKEGTALIMIELLKSHRNHSVDRTAFVALMVKQHKMSPEGVNNRINEGIRLGYVEDLGLVDGTVRGKERLNEDLDYIKALASKYQSKSSRALSESSSAKNPNPQDGGSKR